ncbi:MAG: twin-arginine translocase TatA/TatE family subunit [Fimbriimonadaceae bacterium]
MTNLYGFVLGAQEIILILVVVLLLFGGRKIPELMRGVGRGMGELQKGLEEGKKQMSAITQESSGSEPISTPKPAAEEVKTTNSGS